VAPLVLFLALWVQQPPAQQAAQEPPEEDESLRPKEYAFNPLQATKELAIGNYYFKKGSWKAAALRYEEATRWNPGYGDAFLKWAEALEKLNQKEKAKGVYGKFLAVAPDHKKAGEIRKKLGVKG
jgi:tetratricopeptide (TPR) repeat protein